ncbi:MAG: ATP-grasp domain-containing protein [Candidatus Omnitrophica bacterium]|nr:ATP-grasp domain-containing protein [Candidatus Omnitrophota bacterium]
MLKVALIYNLKRKKNKDIPADFYSEFDSQETVEAVAAALSSAGHKVFLAQADEKIFDWFKNNQVDIVFNMAEGISGSGRESEIPAILDFLGIPYTGSGVLTLALALDKEMSKRIFTSFSIPTPRFQLFRSGDETLKEDLHFPLIIKPNCEGSAKGIHAKSVVNNEARVYEEVARIKKIYQQDALAEEFIEGKEITVGILGNRSFEVLPLLEIDFANCNKKGEFFYSWEVKEYQGIDPAYPDPEFFCPARLNVEQQEGVKKVALAAHQALGCLDVSRVDIRLSPESIPYVLEVNPLPGLDPKESNLTKMAQAARLGYSKLINRILDNALNRYKMTTASKPEAVTKER